MSSLIKLGIIQAVESAFSDIEVPNWKEKVVGFGADGALGNLGQKGGVAAKLKQHVPHLLEVHCFPHRLELAFLNIQQDCKLASKVYDIMHLVSKTYHFSPKSKRDLKTLGRQLGIDVLQPTRVKGSRLLPHVSRALDVFIKPVKDGDLVGDESQYAAVSTPYGTFGHDAWHTEMEVFLNFGREKWFQAPLLSSGCNVSAVQSQWLSLKVLVHSNFLDKGYNDLWAMLMIKEPYKDYLKDVLYLVQILLVLPLSATQRKPGSRTAIKPPLAPKWKT